MIESASFGTITIEGRIFTSDLILLPNGDVIDGWWRKSGHLLEPDDMKPLLDVEPDLIVAGTGIHGRMRPQTGLVPFLKKRGIDFIAEPNLRAIAVYNEKRIEGIVVGACFHLTC